MTGTEYAVFSTRQDFSEELTQFLKRYIREVQSISSSKKQQLNQSLELLSKRFPRLNELVLELSQMLTNCFV